MGKGQEVGAGVNRSRYSRSVNLSFTEPYLFDKNVLLGGEIYLRDYSSYRQTATDNRSETYSQATAGGGLRLGFPVNEYLSFGTRYSLANDKISLDEDTYFLDENGDGEKECSTILAGDYLCDQLGSTLSSVLGYSLVYDTRNGIRATRGMRVVLSQDFAGLGGDTKYARTRLDGTKYFLLPKNFILSVHGEGGYIHPLKSNPEPGVDAIRLTDRFFGPQMRGFDIRGIGPRVERTLYADIEGTLSDEIAGSDAIGGRAYYMGRVELEIPVSAGIKSMGFRPSAFLDVGSVFNLTKPNLDNIYVICQPGRAALPLVLKRDINDLTCPADAIPNDNIIDYIPTPGFKETYLGDSAKPRLSIGIGVNWQSPFGPLRIDVAKALLKQEGDETKLFSFNVGTQF
jgi:outer membrane protein insertion porin family